jgi:hypothetical protein
MQLVRTCSDLLCAVPELCVQACSIDPHARDLVTMYGRYTYSYVHNIDK